MCRIVGIVGEQPQEACENLICMRDAMAHGGPDDAGLFGDDKVWLGHRRLSILDLTPLGRQPMASADGKTWIIYNGEVYNFRELKEELQQNGCRFRSATDTEVILHAYERWGEGAFDRFVGMFAFALYDRVRQLLYLVRDHAGIKPLYYSFRERQLIFASEVRAFKTFCSDWPENPDWRACFLLFGYLPHPFTSLHHVFMLRKGSFLKLDLINWRHSIQKYTSSSWTPEILNPGRAIMEVRECLTKAVTRHLISDAPIGVFLSGGIDSGILAILASYVLGKDLRTLSIVFGEREFSEEEYQKAVVAKIGSDHRSCLISHRDFIANLDDIFHAMDQPSIDGVNTYFISRCAREAGLKAVLSGIGADELFGGYPSFSRVPEIWPLFRLPCTVRLALTSAAWAPCQSLRRLPFLAIGGATGLYLFLRGIFTIAETASLLNASKREIIAALQKIGLDECPPLGPRNFASFLESEFYMENQLLKDTDFMSLWHSVEVRVPFLDRELVKVALKIADRVKFSRNIPKFLLIKAFEDMLPSSLIARKKQGFTFPMALWLKIHGREISVAADTIWQNFLRGSVHWSRLWAWIVLGRWRP